MTNFIIRKAQESDAEKILTYVNEITTETDFLGRHPLDPLPEAESEKRLIKEAEENGIWLLAFAGEKVVGFLAFNRATRIKKRHCAGFGMSVKKAYWSKGIGTALMEEMLKQASKMPGLEKIELSVFADNVRAIALYKKFGFIEEGIERKAYLSDGVYHDEVHMALFLKQ